MGTALTKAQSQERTRLEAIVKSGFAKFIAVGTALLELKRQPELYPEFTTFKAYCRDVFGMSAEHGRRKMDAATLEASLQPIGLHLANERQARVLRRETPAVAAAVLRDAGPKTTAAELHRILERRKATDAAALGQRASLERPEPNYVLALAKCVDKGLKIVATGKLDMVLADKSEKWLLKIQGELAPHLEAEGLAKAA